jgi:magnesium transporter
MSSNQRRRRRRHARSAAQKLGAAPGTPIYIGEARTEPVHVSVIDYDAEGIRTVEANSTSELHQYRDPSTVTWINLDGVHQVDQVQALCRAFGVHPLWVEDIVHTKTRPKADQIDDQVLVIARMLRPRDEEADSPDHDLVTEIEQVAMVMGDGWVLTFQERPGDAWEPVRQRIQSGNGRVRRMRSDYLLYALLDALVDHYFLALEGVEARVDTFEAIALDPDKRVSLQDVFELKGELAEVRRAVWPMRETVNGLLRSDGPMRSEIQPFVRDLYDHVVQVMDIVETSRERIVGVYELHIAIAGHRLNDIMKILTIVSTIFIPMTFVAGVYGMNFDHMPELHWAWGYPFAWVLMLGSGLGGAVFMITRKWV